MLSIIVPAKNESGNFAPLFTRIQNVFRDLSILYEIVVVNDGSSDDSINVLNQLKNDYPLKIVDHKVNKGKAQSILDGIMASEGDICVMIDADLQYPPEAVPEMYRLAGKYDMVVARREVSRERILRKFLSKIHSIIFGRLLFGLSCDIQSGLKLFPKSLIEDIDTSDITPWTLDLSLLLAARRRRYKIGEVPIAFEERRFGKSKVSVFRSVYEHIYTSLRIKLKYLRK